MFKYILSVLVVFTFFGISNTFANIDPVNDYTYVDCQNGSDNTGTGGGVPFDKNNPFLTLKTGIEKTVNYINQEGLTSETGTGLAYSGRIFRIIVRGGCTSAKDPISLDFDGSPNNTHLRISGDTSYFFINNTYFTLARANVGNIVFANAYFLNNDIKGHYFEGYISGLDSQNGSGIKIRDSIINISAGKQLMNFNDSFVGYSGCYYGCRGPIYNNYRPGGYYIENSLINVDVNADYNFMLPVFLKNNKINIKNTVLDSPKRNIGFYVAGNNRDGYNYGSTNLIANMIYLDGNNFTTDNNNSTFINNKFINVGNFTAGTEEAGTKYNAFLNNEVQCQNQVNITNNEAAFNNIFNNGFIDTRDINNFKRNFNGPVQSSTMGVGWLLRKDISSSKKLITDYKTLYKEMTGTDLPLVDNPLYIVIH